ncbi:MAG: DUF983 domain-containing protein [Pseudomonadota bacterium]
MTNPFETSTSTALLRGLSCRCPNCGKGKLFKRFTTINDACSACGLDFTHHRADDAPPYIIIVIVGHIIVPLALIVEKMFQPNLAIHFALWMPLAIISALLLLPPIKGFVIAIQWANEMHGFSRKL